MIDHALVNDCLAALHNHECNGSDYIQTHGQAAYSEMLQYLQGAYRSVRSRWQDQKFGSHD